MPLLTKSRKTAPPEIQNPDAITRHNIGVWRRMGYSDRQIAGMMRPMLKTQDEYERWGLRWSNEAAKPSTPEAAKVCQVIKVKLGVAKAEGRPLNIGALNKMLGRDALTQLRNDDLAVSQLVAAVQAYNKTARQRQPRARVNTQQLQKLAKMESVIAEAEQSGQRLTISEASARIGVSPGWLSNASTKRNSSDPEVRRQASELVCRLKALREKYPPSKFL